MLTIYRDASGSLHKTKLGAFPKEVIWIDLVDPSGEEKVFVETKTGVQVPTIDALNEIESSSRLIAKPGAVYLSMPLVAHGDTDDPFLSPVGFILSSDVLVTVRFAELPIFGPVARDVNHDESIHSGSGVFAALMEALVDRGADVLERLAEELDHISRSVFRGDPGKLRHTVRSNDALRRALASVGFIGDRLSQARVVFLGVGRMIPFVLSQKYDWLTPELGEKLDAVLKDVASLNDYEGYLTNKVQFLLDAVLGFITVEQNDLFKVLTIVSVVGIPPTLMAGIYGMNFKFMPELSWEYGYPFGLFIIALSALVPLVWFKLRGWF